MKILSIVEGSNSNILTMTIKSKIGIKQILQSGMYDLINNELFYLVTVNGINKFQAFRIAQNMRNDVRIFNDDNIMLIDELLPELFPGTDDDPEVNVSIAKQVLDLFSSLSKQMKIDSDVIGINAANLFNPMIFTESYVTFKVPFSAIASQLSEELYNEIYNENYPNTLSKLDNPELPIYNYILCSIAKCTGIVSYPEKYDKLLERTKYVPLKNHIKHRLHRFGILSFFKDDKISKKRIVCDTFKPNKEIINNNMKILSVTSGELEFNVAIQLPIHHMTNLLLSYDNNILPIKYESSMVNILNNGIQYDDFKYNDISEYKELDEETHAMIEMISMYKTRITDVNEKTNILINKLLDDMNVDVSLIASLLPGKYSTNCVITYKRSNYDIFKSNIDPIIVELFEDIDNACDAIEKQLK